MSHGICEKLSGARASWAAQVPTRKLEMAVLYQGVTRHRCYSQGPRLLGWHRFPQGMLEVSVFYQGVTRHLCYSQGPRPFSFLSLLPFCLSSRLPDWLPFRQQVCMCVFAFLDVSLDALVIAWFRLSFCLPFCSPAFLTVALSWLLFVAALVCYFGSFPSCCFRRLFGCFIGRLSVCL